MSRSQIKGQSHSRKTLRTLYNRRPPMANWFSIWIKLNYLFLVCLSKSELQYSSLFINQPIHFLLPRCCSQCYCYLKRIWVWSHISYFLYERLMFPLSRLFKSDDVHVNSTASDAQWPFEGRLLIDINFLEDLTTTGHCCHATDTWERKENLNGVINFPKLWLPSLGICFMNITCHCMVTYSNRPWQ